MTERHQGYSHGYVERSTDEETEANETDQNDGPRNQRHAEPHYERIRDGRDKSPQIAHMERKQETYMQEPRMRMQASANIPEDDKPRMRMMAREFHSTEDDRTPRMRTSARTNEQYNSDSDTEHNHHNHHHHDHDHDHSHEHRHKEKSKKKKSKYMIKSSALTDGRVERAEENRIQMPASAVHLNPKHDMVDYRDGRGPFRRAESKSFKFPEPIDIVVYFMDKTGLNLRVQDGQITEAGELFEWVMQEMKLPDEAREVFSLWLVSDLLELQLKPNQIPFKIACYWEEFLEKYTSATEEDIERDEPVLMFQRNVFYSRSKEMKVSNPELLRLLYHEAKENIIDGRYPVAEREADELAGLHALLVHKHYDSSMHDGDYFKPILDEYLPASHRKKKGFFGGSGPKPEDRISICHNAAFNKHGNMDRVEARKSVYLNYLNFCWTLPFYGAAFFSAQIEHPQTAFNRNAKDDPVYLAVNPSGVHIIDMDDTQFLMGLLFSDRSKGVKWEYAEPASRSRSAMPCIFLTFNDRERNESYTKVLQVFTREAALVDALMSTCAALKAERRKKNPDVTDFVRDEDDDGVIESKGETWKEFNRLCLTTFNKRGQVIESKIRKK